MFVKLEKTMLIEASNGFEYVVMSVLEEDGKEYAFANKLVDEDPTMEYSIFTIENDMIVMLDDEPLMRLLLPKFQEDMNSDLLKFVDFINEGAGI